MVERVAHTIYDNTCQIGAVCFEVISELTKRVIQAAKVAFVWFIQFVDWLYNAYSNSRPRESTPLDHFSAQVSPQTSEAVEVEEPEEVEEPIFLNPQLDMETLKRNVLLGIKPENWNSMAAEDICTLCKEYPVRYSIYRDGVCIENGEVEQGKQAHEHLAAKKEEVRAAYPNTVEGERAAERLSLRIIFPYKRRVIANWVNDWAAAKTLTVDPESPIYPMIQGAFSRRNAIEGGMGCSADPSSYHPESVSYWDTSSRFEYIIFSLIGFQELAREKHIELFACLDDLSLRNGRQNPGYAFVSDLSRIFTYPRAMGGSVDVLHKIQNGVGSCITAFEKAVEHDCVDEFYDECFISSGENPYCFDLRVQKFQEFSGQLSVNLDFFPKCIHTDSVDVKVARYLEAFRNIQLMQYVEDHPLAGLNYSTFKEQFIRDDITAEVRDFAQNYYTKTKFATYLREQGEPIRRASLAQPDDPRIGIRFDSTKAYISATRDEIPIQRHSVGATVALRDMHFTWYQAVVAEVTGDRIRLDLRGAPIERREWEQTLNIFGIQLQR